MIATRRCRARRGATPKWTNATQACFVCVVEAADCTALQACGSECPQLND